MFRVPQFIENDLEGMLKDFGVQVYHIPLWTLNKNSQLELMSWDNGRQIWAIFDDTYNAINPQTEFVESFSPELQVKTSDVLDAYQGDIIYFEGRKFKIIELQQDGTGVTVIRMSED